MIGKIDKNSPAEEAGLKPLDKIIEINGINVTRRKHNQLVEIKKAGGDDVRMLAAESERRQKDDKQSAKCILI